MYENEISSQYRESCSTPIRRCGIISSTVKQWWLSSRLWANVCQIYGVWIEIITGVNSPAFPGWSPVLWTQLPLHIPAACLRCSYLGSKDENTILTCFTAILCLISHLRPLGPLEISWIFFSPSVWPVWSVWVNTQNVLWGCPNGLLLNPNH